MHSIFYARRWAIFALLVPLLAGVFVLGATGCARPFAARTDTAARHSTDAARAPAQSLNRSIQIDVLAAAISKNLARVEEFRIIQAASKELGLRVWLFGGTAAGYAHYVKWDLLRLSGDARYIESRFDYDFTNIYRSTQDADLVVDGSVEDASKLESLIKSKLAYLQGSKKEWEVRLLRKDRGEKQALLNNPDFMNQHTDSNSTGMIELTPPPSSESVVRDLRDWKDMRSPQFLQDVAEGKLHYYYNPLHKTTSRHLAGDNPEIFSVVRYFTKAFQYELEMRDEDLAHIRKIIAHFNPQTSPARWSEWARGWIESRGNGAKLIKHAVNIEYAWNVLEDFGLRRKLIAMSSPKSEGSMGWWLNREPLRSRPLGEGGGKTAKEIAAKFDIPWDEFVVAHETGDFLAYESLTRDTTGRPNVLISREGFAGEVATYGDGHYTRVGRVGARGTGLTVRYKIDPNAREGTDFIVKDDFMIFRNRNALWALPESLNIGPIEYFQLLFSSETMDASDRGVLEKLKRRINNQVAHASVEDARAIANTILAELNRKQEPSTQWEQRMERHVAALNHWFSLPASVNFPEVVTTLINRDGRYDQALAEYVIWRPHWVERKEWAIEIFERPFRKHYGWHTRQVLDPLFKNVFSQPEWKDDPRLLQIIENILSNEKMYPAQGAYWSSFMGQLLIWYVLSQPHWSHRPDLVERFLKAGVYDEQIAAFILDKPYWDRSEWYQTLASKHKPEIDEILIQTLAAPSMVKYPERISALITSKRYDEQLLNHVLSKPFWWDVPECEGWLDLIIKRNLQGHQYRLDRYVLEILQSPRWKHRPDWLRIVISRAKTAWGDDVTSVSSGDIAATLAAPHWAETEFPEKKAGFFGRCEGLLKNHLRSWYWRTK